VQFRVFIVFATLILTVQLKAQGIPSEMLGEKTYAKHCAACHGPVMQDPQWGIDLLKFPVDSKLRFIDSVSYGKNAMPPWDDILSSPEIEALWAYFLKLSLFNK
jgi:cytochrome c5